MYSCYDNGRNPMFNCAEVRPLSGADPDILKRGGPNPGQKGGSNYMSPFKCIDRPKNGGFQHPNPPPPTGSNE